MNTKNKVDMPETEAEVVKTEIPPKVPKFAIERLRKDCLRLFDVTLSTFNGAVCGLTGEYTVEEMRKRIDAWRGKQVNPAKLKKEAK